MDRRALAVFENKEIRKTWHKEEWWFSVTDVVGALTQSENPRNYWNMLKARESENGIELYTFCVQLKLPSADGKSYETDCANTEGLFRIIQSIPSKKAHTPLDWPETHPGVPRGTQESSENLWTTHAEPLESVRDEQ